MYDALVSDKEPGSHLNTYSAEHEGCSCASSVEDAAGCHYRNVQSVNDLRNESHSMVVTHVTA